MGLRLDKFTVAIIALVAILLAVAVFTVNRAGGPSIAARTDDSPEATIINAYLALQKTDVTEARSWYSTQVLEEVDSDDNIGSCLRTDTSYPCNANTNQRLRVIQVEPDSSNADRMKVTIAIDNYYDGGPFGGSSVYSGGERVVLVVREDNRWKIDQLEYFY